MKVLIAVASKHGATAEIAQAIARTLQEQGITPTVAPVDNAPAIDEFDAIVLGSAVYMGRWMSEARVFVDDHADELRGRPLWLFSSGPIGTPPKPAGGPADLPALLSTLAPRDHHLFAGRVVRADLGFGERTVLKMVGAPEGDFRDFGDVAAWAKKIADTLLVGSPAPALA